MSVASSLRRHRSTILFCIVLVLAAWIFIPQLGALQESIQTLASANLGWVLIATILFYTGIPVISTQLSFITFKKLAYSLTLRVQAATLFVNKILPQGVGTISLNIYYFIKKGHTPNQAATVMTMNAILSMGAYIVLIIFALLLSDISLKGIFENSDEVSVNLTALVILVIIGTTITLISAKNLRAKIFSITATFKKNIASYKKRPKDVLINTFLNGVGTSINVLTLLLCAKAVGIDISFADALLAYTFGNFAAALVPTPGGVGSAEMGIYSGLVIIGLDSATAISVTLLYRLISYWLAILPGYFFFRSLKKTLLANYTITSSKKPA